MTDDPRDDTLERAFRQGLRQAADRTEVGVPLVARAHAGARTRRRRRWAVVGAVAAVVAVSGVAVAVQSGDEPGRRSTDQAVSEPTTPAPVTEWRAESWHNLTVDVPADWGWGTAPTSNGGYLCGGPGAMVPATGRKKVNPDAATPWVGRPIMLSDLCGRELDWIPAAPYVWLGADVAPGTEELGDGYVQETVEAFDTTLTVGTQDPGVREQIIASARASATCAASLSKPPEVDSMLMEGMRPVRTAELCAYARGGAGFDLTYATTLDEATAQATYDGGYAGQRDSSPAFCPDGGDEYVVITFTGDDPYGATQVTQKVVIDPVCREFQGSPGMVSPLSDAGMLPWSHNGLQAVLRAFIGMLG